MTEPLHIRPIEPADFEAWLPLWDGYNAFYGRKGPTALDPETTRIAWQRFLDPEEPMFALVAQARARLLGLVHYVIHRSTSRIEPVCYLKDLFTAADMRGQGVGRALIEAVYADAPRRGARRVYWHTRTSNLAGRRLYDQVAEHRGFIVYSIDL